MGCLCGVVLLFSPLLLPSPGCALGMADAPQHPLGVTQSTFIPASLAPPLQHPWGTTGGPVQLCPLPSQLSQRGTLGVRLLFSGCTLPALNSTRRSQ